jgi:hypothetical protein
MRGAWPPEFPVTSETYAATKDELVAPALLEQPGARHGKEHLPMQHQSKHAAVDGEQQDPMIDPPRTARVANSERPTLARLPALEWTDQFDMVTANGLPRAAHMRLARLELHLRPIGLRAANAFVATHHRHHGPTRGHKFSISVADSSGEIRGVVIAGRPVARRLDDGDHLEVLRVCTDGTPNVCSILLGAVRRAAKAMGYRPEKIITYTLEGEHGASLRAAGWKLDGSTDGGSWNRPSRSRIDRHPTERKLRWHAI